jgi:hypothetical protein
MFHLYVIVSVAVYPFTTPGCEISTFVNAPVLGGRALYVLGKTGTFIFPENA